MKKITILIPVYNEENNIEPLYRQLQSLSVSVAAVNDSGEETIMDMSGFEWEFLFVNDGSKDRSLERLMALRSDDQRVNVINFSRNFGKETALLAGMDYSDGDAVVIMDADLQHPAALVPEMIYWWERGFDDVYGQRVDRGREPWLRKRFSRLFYRLLQNSSKAEVLANAGDFRLLSRRAVNAIIKMRESQRYTKGLYCWVGFNKKGIPFTTAERNSGKSTFSYKSLFNLAIDGITSYTTSPLRIASVMGIIVSLMSLIYLLVVLIKYFICGEAVRGYPTLICIILFLGGVQLLALGVIGEYVGRIFNEAKRRPPYIVESVNGEDDCEGQKRMNIKNPRL